MNPLNEDAGTGRYMVPGVGNIVVVVVGVGNKYECAVVGVGNKYACASATDWGVSVSCGNETTFGFDFSGSNACSNNVRAFSTAKRASRNREMTKKGAGFNALASFIAS